jgi:branched-chain amino acid transport system permease protein
MGVLAVVIDGLVYASWLFTTAVGLTLIYGVMNILNLAHGSLYALGAYAAASLGGYWLAHGYAPMGSFAVLIFAALLVGGIAGPIVERGLLRYMYGKDEVVLMLVTYSVFLILEDLIKLVFGVDPYFFAQPYGLLGSIHIGSLTYPAYNAVIVAVAVVTAGLLTWFLGWTRKGKLLVAVIQDRDIAAAMGVNVERFYLVTFSAGAMLAALGGALTAPTVSIIPGMGVEVIVLAFAVIVIGGLGSLPGAALGAVIVGLVRSAAVRYLPEVELFSVYFVMALVLLLRPRGLFGAPEARKI